LLKDENNTYLKSPGPGSYQSLPAINEKGVYNISKYHKWIINVHINIILIYFSSGANTFSPITSKRFKTDCKIDNTPGAGTYDHVITLN